VATDGTGSSQAWKQMSPFTQEAANETLELADIDGSVMLHDPCNAASLATTGID